VAGIQAGARDAD